MRVERPGRVQEFVDRAGGFLGEREAEHNLLLGICAQLQHDPQLYGSDTYLAVVEDAGRVVAAALRTPPHHLVLSEADDEDACAALAADVHRAFGSLPGLTGPVATGARFAREWEALTGARGRITATMRIYRAETVVHPAGVGGALRPYEPGDREVALRWLEAFVAEAMPGGSHESAADILDRRLAGPEEGFVVWDTVEAASLAGYAGPTPNGIRIGPVYTPPELRGRGYASALTAALTQQLLAGGRRFCFLFTDLANPTANSIYQRVGYEPVTDIDHWAFE